MLALRLPALCSPTQVVWTPGEGRDANKTRHDVSPACLCLRLAHSSSVGDQIHTQGPGGLANHTTPSSPLHTPLPPLRDLWRAHIWTATTTKFFYETAMYIPRRRVTSRAYRHSHTPYPTHTHSHRGTGGQRTHHVGLTSHPTGRHRAASPRSYDTHTAISTTILFRRT